MDEVILGRNVRLYGSDIYQSVLFSGVRVGHGCSFRRVIIDEDVPVPPNTRIGYDIGHDRARGLFVDEESGIVVVPKGYVFKVSA